MLISTRGRYALRVMIDLAQQGGERFVPLKEVAARQGISEKYLESIISALSKADYVEGVRGKGGGYKLSRSAETYSVGSILKITEGNLAPVECLKCQPNQCERAETCITLPMWEELGEVLEQFFEGKTLAELAGK